MKKPTKLVANPYLKQARERQGWSQEYVAREAGTDAFTVSRWERGVTMPSPHFRQQLCRLFGLNALELGLMPVETEERAAQATNRATVKAIGHVEVAIQEPVIDPAIPPLLLQGHGLVGRDELLRELKGRLLAGGHVALSAFNGLPGVGKTALVTSLAHDKEVRAHFVDGVLWAGLGYEPDVLGLLSRWGKLLDAAPYELAQRSRPEAWAASIHASIGQRSMLLVIDDAWDIAHALAFQVGGPRCTHLVTTRFPEIARRFAAEGALVVHELKEDEGRLLLLRLAPELVEAEPVEAQALVAAVGGLPLALTLLGNYLRGQAASGQPRRLRAALERLRNARGRLQLAEPQALVGGHPSLSAGSPLSLQAVIGISDQQVSGEARATLRALGVFPPKPNTFSEEAAAAVSGLPVEALDELTDAGLLESSGAGRYTLHQVIADYARTHLEDERVGERLVMHFVAYAERHVNDYPALERESSNMLAALEVAYERGMREEHVRGVHAFASFLENNVQDSAAREHLLRAQEATRALNDITGQARVCLYLGRLQVQGEEYAAARDYWMNGLELARRISDDRLVAELLLGLGELAWKQGQPEQAYQFLEEALTLARQTGEQKGEGVALRNLGILARERGQPEWARKLYEEALVAFHQVKEQGEVARTLNNLGVLARQQGQPESARQLFEQALAIFREVRDRSGEANTLGNLGRIAENQGQLELAIQLYEESLAMFRQLAEKRRVAQVLHNLGTIAWQQGQPASARQLYEEALVIGRQIEDRRTLALTLTELGALEREQRQLEQAHKHLEEAKDVLFALGDRREVAVAQRELGALARQWERTEEAHQRLEDALSTLRQLEDRREVARTLKELGMLARQEGQLEEAKEWLDETLAILLSLGDAFEVALTRKEAGMLAREQGQPEQAHVLLNMALASLRQLGARRNVAQTLKELGLAAQQRGQEQEALVLLLCAGVGLALVESPEKGVVEEMLKEMGVKLGEDALLAAAKRAAKEAPEACYGLDQAEWVAAIRKMAREALPA